MPRGLRSGRATTLHTATGQGEVRVKRAPRHGAVFRQVAQIIVGMHARALGVKKQEVVPPGRPGESSGCQVITPPGQEAWMNVHKNARLTLRRRQELVRRLEAGAPLKGQARRMEISVRTARKWWGRYRTEGSAGLLDRSSPPPASPARTAAPPQPGLKVMRWQQRTRPQNTRA